MKNDLSSVSNKSIIELIIRNKKESGIDLTENNIHLLKDAKKYYNFTINNVIAGYFSLCDVQNGCYKLHFKNDNNTEKLLAGMTSRNYFYYNSHFEKTSTVAVVTERKLSKREDDVHDWIKISCSRDNENTLKAISINCDEGIRNVLKLVKRDNFLSLEDENINALMYYYQFMKEDDFKTVFESLDIEHLKTQLSFEDIKNRVTLLRAMEY